MTLPAADVKVTPTQARRQEMRERAVELMRSHLAQSDYSLQHLADELHISGRQLQRVLKDLPRGGFRSELCYWRMIEAARLLSDGKAAVNDIAPQVGYTQPMHFSKAFRRQFHCSPRQWRSRCAHKLQAKKAVRH